MGGLLTSLPPFILGLTKGWNHEEGKSKVEQCSHTSKWPLTGADEVEAVSQRPSVAMTSMKRVSSSAVEVHCKFPMKAKNNQGSPERTSCLVLHTVQAMFNDSCQRIQKPPAKCKQPQPHNETTTNNLECSHPN